MLRYCLFAGFAGLLALTAACTKPVSDARDASIAAVRAEEAQWVKDAATKDVEKFVSHYAESASLLLPNAPVINGKDAIRSGFKPMLADPNFALTFQATRAESSDAGDIVYTQGQYTMTVTDPKDKTKTVTDKGKYVTVFRKQPDGSYKAVADMLNSDLPAGT
jgi:uncharacterized protein (TIGR02246 family)